MRVLKREGETHRKIIKDHWITTIVLSEESVASENRIAKSAHYTQLDLSAALRILVKPAKFSCVRGTVQQRVGRFGSLIETICIHR